MFRGRHAAVRGLIQRGTRSEAIAASFVETVVAVRPGWIDRIASRRDRDLR